MSDWLRKFDKPIATPDGGTLRTLRNAAEYIQRLPNAEQTRAHWNLAVETLQSAAEGGLIRFAELAVRRALLEGAPPEPTRKRAKKRKAVR